MRHRPVWIGLLTASVPLMGGSLAKLLDADVVAWGGLLLGLSMFVLASLMLLLGEFWGPVSFTLKSRGEWLEDRRPHHGCALKLHIRVRQTARAAIPYLTSIQRWEHGAWSKPLNHGNRLRLGWPAGDESWLPRDLTGDDAVVLGITEPQGLRLEIFSNNHFAEFEEFRRNVPLGRYKLDVALTAEGIRPIRTSLLFDWTGSWDDSELSVVRR